MEMTRKKLSQIYYLKKELKMWEKELDDLIEASQFGSKQMDGMPYSKTNSTSDKVADTAMKIIEREQLLEAFRDDIQKKIDEVYMYLRELDDSFLKQIIVYRCCELKTWDEVAQTIGAGTSADSCKMYFHRKIPKE